MKRIIVLIFSIFLITLSGCDTNLSQSNDKDKKLADLQKQVEELKKEKEDDLFKKKQECIKYKDDMLAFARNTYDTEWIPKWSEDWTYKIYQLDEIFYSSVWKSCYFITNWFRTGTRKGTNSMLFDYLNQTLILSSYPEDCFYQKTAKEKTLCIQNAWDDFRNKLKELKGE